MSLRRLIPYLVLFVVLMVGYFSTGWYQKRKGVQEQEAKKVFAVKEADITDLALKKGKEEIRLARQGDRWQITKPLKAEVDKDAIATLLTSLASLKKERELGAAGDLKNFGLDQPILTVEFTARGKAHRLALGANTPGNSGLYAYRDQDAGKVFVLGLVQKDALDRPLSALRDKTILPFSLGEVKALALKSPKLFISLEKTGPQAWRWVGREKTPVRADRVEQFLRTLHSARAKEFVDETPKDLKRYNLGAPQAEVVVTQGDKPLTLVIGGKAPNGDYARRGEQGPVMLAEKDLLTLIGETMANIDDKRLWRGQIGDVHKLVWGPPEKTWTALKEKDSWKIAGPEKQEQKQASVKVEIALSKLQNLELLAPQSFSPPEGRKPLFLVELFGADGKTMFRLEDWGKKGDQHLQIRAQSGDQSQSGTIYAAPFQGWQAEMQRLGSPPPQVPMKK